MLRVMRYGNFVMCRSVYVIQNRRNTFRGDVLKGNGLKLSFLCKENLENFVGYLSGSPAKKVGKRQILTIKTINFKSLVKDFGRGAGYLN